MKTLNIDPKRVNIKGGAIALGHPLGATGVRLIGNLARILNQEKGKMGLGMCWWRLRGRNHFRNGIKVKDSIILRIIFKN